MRWIDAGIRTGLLLLLAVDACAFTVRVTSSPTGSEVWASPVDQPVMYRKGTTPCEIELSGEGAPHAILIRRRGYFDAYHYAEADTSQIDVALPSRDDAGNWLRLPGIHQYLDIDVEPAPAMKRYERRSLLAGLPVWLEHFCGWAPDASAFAASGSEWGHDLVEAGLAQDEEASVSDLWWVPVDGEPVLVHRWLGEDPYRSFTMNAEFTPDPRWLAHSAAVGEREEIHLWCSATAESRVIASDENETLYCPRPSPDGRLIACVAETLIDDLRRDLVPHRPVEEPAARVEIMHHDGAGRRVLVEGVHEWNDPVFSPDGRRLACAMADGSVTVVSISGEPRTVIRQEHWRPAANPIWSPDGRRVAILCSCGDDKPGMGGGFGGGDARRTFWARIDGSESGFIRGGRAIQWFDDASLLMVLRGFDAAAGRSYGRVAVVGLDGAVRRVLIEPETIHPTEHVRVERDSLPCSPEKVPPRLDLGLAPTLPTGGAAQ